MESFLPWLLNIRTCAPSFILEGGIFPAPVSHLYQIGLSELASYALPNSTVVPRACPSSYWGFSGYRWKGYTVARWQYVHGSQKPIVIPGPNLGKSFIINDIFLLLQTFIFRDLSLVFRFPILNDGRWYSLN